MKTFNQKLFVALPVITLLCCLLLPGCAGSGSPVNLQSIAVKAGTVALFANTGISPEEVINQTHRLKVVIEQDQQLDTTALVNDLMGLSSVQALEPATRLVLHELVVYIQRSVDDSNLLVDDKRLSLLRMIAWVEDAARLSLSPG